MLPFQSCSGLESWLGDRSNGMSVLQEPRSLRFQSTQMDGRISTLSSSSAVERKSTETCKSHKEAERRRRQRINAHLSTLRSILPKAAKADKASLLAEVVQHVRQLRREVTHVAQLQGWDVSCSDGSSTSGSGSDHSATDTWPFPGESDEVTLTRSEEGGLKLLKATVCCEDRDNLNRDLSRAIQSVRAKVVKAKMVTIGGRTKNVVVMQWPSNGGEEEVGALKRALNAMIDNRASFGSGLDRVMIGNKRVRDPYGLVTEVDYE